MMKERVVVFGDAIIAIIITIIVLELPISYASNGAIHYGELLRAVGIYFISFCFVANLWFQTAYAFNRVEQVKNNVLVVYLLLLFGLSLVPSATRLLIEDTTRQTVFIYGVLTFLVTFVMRRMIVSLTRQSFPDAAQKKRRTDELNRQDLFSLVARLILLALGYFFTQAVLVIYLVFPILAFLQNIVDREEDAFVDTLALDEQNDYFHDRNDLWGNPLRRYGQLLRESLKDSDQNDPAWREQITKEWQKKIGETIGQLERKIATTSDPQKQQQLKVQVTRLKQQQEGFNRRLSQRPKKGKSPDKLQ